MENNRTISILMDILNSDVWVYLKDQETCRRFYEDAEAEEARIPGYYEIIERLAEEAIAALKNK